MRYVRDMVYSLVKRKLNHKNIGHLCERRSGPNVKENLVKDTHDLYSLGEESIQSLPKSMLKPDSKNRHQESQTDSVLCKTLFVSKSELDDLRTELLLKLSELKEVKTHTYRRCQPPNLALTSPCISSPHSTPVAADLQVSAGTSVSSEVNLSYPSSQKNESSLKNPSGVSSTENQAVDNNKVKKQIPETL